MFQSPSKCHYFFKAYRKASETVQKLDESETRDINRVLEVINDQRRRMNIIKTEEIKSGSRKGKM